MNARMINYARAILNVINVGKGDKVWVYGPMGAKELLLELQRQIIKLGAFADMDVYFEESIFTFLHDSSVEQLKVFSNVEKVRTDTCDKHIIIWCNDKYVVDFSKIPPENLKTRRATTRRYRKRLDSIPTVSAGFLTKKDAKECGMDWERYQDFFFNGVEVDLNAIYNKFRWLEEKINRGRKIKIVSTNTDLIMSIEWRKCISNNTIMWNLPDGELFTSPVEDSVDGYVYFEHEQTYEGSSPVKDLQIEFKKGKMVKFNASEGKESFERIINTDEGVRRVGEVGFGINHGIPEITGNNLFDEKILGTVHIALGKGFEKIGGTNESDIHWDLVKDIRKDGKVYIDDEIVFENGKWIND